MKPSLSALGGVLVNQILQADDKDLSPTDLFVKRQLLAINREIDQANTQVANLAQALKEAQARAARACGQFEGIALAVQNQEQVAQQDAQDQPKLRRLEDYAKIVSGPPDEKVEPETP
jgi:regulator of protease activity HflC (stomatin/prohibitin superfamily)